MVLDFEYYKDLYLDLFPIGWIYFLFSINDLCAELWPLVWRLTLKWH